MVACSDYNYRNFISSTVEGETYSLCAGVVTRLIGRRPKPEEFREPAEFTRFGIIGN